MCGGPFAGELTALVLTCSCYPLTARRARRALRYLCRHYPCGYYLDQVRFAELATATSTLCPSGDERDEKIFTVSANTGGNLSVLTDAAPAL